MRCSECERDMRDYGVKRADAPGTVPRGNGGACQACANRRGGKPAVAPVDDAPCVIVRANLRPSTYRAFAEHAKDLGVDVGVLLSRLADRAVRRETTTDPSAKRRPPDYVEDEIDARIRELNAQRLSDAAIAKQVGMAQASISRRRKLLGLLPPRPQYGGRRRAA